MTFEERKAQVKSYLGKNVIISIDRPIGYTHYKENYSLTYPINYGYIPDVIGGDGEELDVYLIGVNEPVTEYECQIIAVAHRIFPSGNAVKHLSEYFDLNDTIKNPYHENPEDIKAICFSANGDILGSNIYERDIVDILKTYKP